MLDTQGYILITLVLTWITLCIVFIWLHFISKILIELQSGIHNGKEILWHMQQLLSALDVDGSTSPEDTKNQSCSRLLTDKPTECVRIAFTDSIRKTPIGSSSAPGLRKQLNERKKYEDKGLWPKLRNDRNSC